MGGSQNSTRARKIITRVIVFLLLGAIVNVAVAWGAAVDLFGRTPVEMAAAASDPPESAFYYCAATVRESRCKFQLEVWQASGFEGAWQDIRFVEAWPVLVQFVRPRDEDATETSTVHRIVQGSGWPAYSMIGGFNIRVQWNISKYVGSTFSDTWGAILVPSRNRDPWGDIGATPLLPLHPLWPGFAINTLFYAAILWALFAVPAALRRVKGGRRIKRGLCPKCGYPIGTSAVCTECGTLLPHHRGLDSR